MVLGTSQCPLGRLTVGRRFGIDVHFKDTVPYFRTTVFHGYAIRRVFDVSGYPVKYKRVPVAIRRGIKEEFKVGGGGEKTDKKELSVHSVSGYHRNVDT